MSTQPIRSLFRIFYIATYLVVGGTIASYAAPHRMRNMGTQDGLQDLLVNCIHSDEIGMIWLGTSSSVEMFDGVHFHHFALPGNNGPQKRVTAIAGDPRKSLWAGNGYGLWWHDLKAETFEQRFADQIMGGVTDLAMDSAGVLYVATTMGLYTVENDQVTSYKLYPTAAMQANGVRAISMDETGTLWMTSAEGLHAMLPNRQIVHFTGDKPEGGFTYLTAKDGVVWLGTFHDGLYAFDIPTSTFRQERKMIVPISALQACANHQLLIGTDGNGVLQYDARSGQVVQTWSQAGEKSSQLTSNSVYSLLQDERGILWVGLYQHGVDYTLWQGDRLNVHKTPMFNSEGIAVRALCIHEQQRLIGTRQGLYFIDKATQRFRHFGEKELDAQMVFAIHRLGDYYYIGTYGGGLRRLNPKTLQMSEVEGADKNGRQIFCLTEDQAGHMWVGTEHGVYCTEHKNGRLLITEHYSTRNSQLPADIVYTIYFDREGRGWIGTTGGLALYNAETQTVRTDGFPASFPAKTVVRQVWQNKKGVLYFVPEKGEVFAIDDQWRAQTIHGDHGGDVLFVTNDGNDNLLLGTGNGLYYIKTDGTTERLDFSDGLPSSIFTLCQPQTDEEGTVWMGNSEGLIWFKPDSIAIPNPSRHVFVTRILANNQPIDGSAEAIAAHQVRLPRGCSNFTVQFSDMSFTHPSCMKYELLLGGLDTEWQVLTGVSEHTWHNLRAGQYTMRVRSPGNPESEYTLHVRVPLSNEALLWIISIVLLAVIIAGVVLDLQRRHRHRKQQEEAERVEAERGEEKKYKTANIPVAELRKLKKQVDELMAEEQLYLNPELKLSDIANKLNTSSFVLSYLFNQHMGTSFYDYINNLRVENFKQRAKNGETKLYTLDALATRCGYNSRTTFFRNFKKATGMTPSEYLAGK